MLTFEKLVRRFASHLQAATFEEDNRFLSDGQALSPFPFHVKQCISKSMKSNQQYFRARITNSTENLFSPEHGICVTFNWNENRMVVKKSTETWWACYITDKFQPVFPVVIEVKYPSRQMIVDVHLSPVQTKRRGGENNVKVKVIQWCYVHVAKIKENLAIASSIEMYLNWHWVKMNSKDTILFDFY